MAVAKVTGFKAGTKIRWTRRNGEKSVGIVKKKIEMKNGVWLETKVEGQKTLSKVRAQQATALS